MRNYATEVQSRLIASSRIEQQNKLTSPFYLQSKIQRHKQTTKQNDIIEQLNHIRHEQYRANYKQSLKQLIQKWLDYQRGSLLNYSDKQSNSNKSSSEKQLYHNQPSDKKYSPVYMSISPLEWIKNSPNDKVKQFALSYYKNNMTQFIKQEVSQEIINFLHRNHNLLKKINFNLVQTLINIGVFTKYVKGQQIKYVYYSQKYKNQYFLNKRLGIILYGEVKLYNKIRGFQCRLNQQDTLGQHSIQSVGIRFEDYRNVNVKAVEEETVILWIKKQHYQILFKQSMKCGLKQEVKKLQGHLKINWIKKGIKKFQ